MENLYALEVYSKRPVVLVRAKNAKIWDINGKEYIDCAAGIGVANIGHANPEVVETIKEQAEKFITCPGIFYNDVRSTFLKLLISIAPSNITKAFLCNSGTESIEAAIKFARYSTNKIEIVCANRGFHGRTLGALSATFNSKYKKDFLPLVEGFHHVPFNDIKKLQEKITVNTAAIILEIVQGEGGIRIGQPDYFHQVQKLCRQQGILLIIDEIQTGFCRTGAFFACNHYNIEPDIMCVAKGMAGGIPMGAVLCSDKIKMKIGLHGSTFGGNPLVCATASTVINYMLKHNLAQQALDKGKYFVSEFKKHEISLVREVRHLGLMIGIEIKQRVKPYILKLLEQGVIVLPAGTTVIRLLPPLTISYEELDIVVKKLIKILLPNAK